MSFTLPEGLAPEVYPLAWLVGRWRGVGAVGYPNLPEAAIVQEVVVDHDGGPYLSWSATTWLAPATAEGGDGAADGAPGADGGPAADEPVWARESGFWRVPTERPADLPADKHPVELLLVDPSGHLTLYAGMTGNGRIDLVNDVIVRSPDAAEVTAATRLLGLVQGELMWTWDLAAFGEPLQSYASTRLVRQ